MKPKSNKRVIFHPIKKKNEKVLALVQIVKKYFLSNHHLDILVENLEAAQKISELIWKYPKDSFIPHAIGPHKESIIRILPLESFENKGVAILNLSQIPLSNEYEYQTIIELDDQTSESKKMLSKTKYNFYKDKGLKIATI